MMTLCFGKFADCLHEGQCLAKVAEPKLPLNAVSIIAKLPRRHLGVEALSFLLRQRRDAATAGRTGFFSQSVQHVVNSSECCSSTEQTRPGSLPPTSAIVSAAAFWRASV